MKTKEFLKKHDACSAGARWALSVSDDMVDVWNAMIAQDKRDWLLWIVSRPGVFSESVLRKLSCRFVRETPLADGRKVWDLLTDERSRKAVEVAEAYADGKATYEELDAAFAAANAATRAAFAAYDAARAAARDAATDAATRATFAAYAAAYVASRAAAYDAAFAAYDAARDADRAAARAAYAAADAAYDAAYDAADAAYDAARDAAKEAQVRMIAELGNPFKENE